MKRGADREMASPQKRHRAAHEIRVLIPSRMAGSVIGKGGANISRLRTENRATVNVPDCSGPERIITVGADDQDTVLNVLAQVLQLIQDDLGKNEDLDTSSMEVRALFHHSQVGSIIGKGGSKIKELREATNAQIKVYGNVCPRSTDRAVAINGPIDVCIETLNKCLALVSENPPKGPIERYDPHNFDEFHAMEYGGFGEPRGGGGGDFFRGPPPPRGPHRGFRPRGNGGRGDGMGRGGGRGGGGGMFSGNGFGPRPPFPGGTMGVGPAGGVGGGDGDQASSSQVTIPNEYAGAIIGKGGMRIRRIRAESGAGITLAESAPGQNERIITISGSQGQIRMAQYLLQQSVKEHL
ncbi:heterogeneous nuclear ribonucleoprotein K [Folsomia candida]|uniref:Heterogeneous nuclear ribonucleoprotein K n=1 Tax=Folsomia candida TaxID=158441 RepID=A0A226F5H2_FOLCA|nr:heterogeneous nuclear ribonucleoprotein K [Folsomia candida]XP_021943734.1 heterogeneous nuclear ribonucleoprotein K [Folsomia candida]OXA64431.1 Heterogeneous nuclear ribonucleoprotein K [Folsomia candida]